MIKSAASGVDLISWQSLAEERKIVSSVDEVVELSAIIASTGHPKLPVACRNQVQESYPRWKEKVKSINGLVRSRCEANLAEHDHFIRSQYVSKHGRGHATKQRMREAYLQAQYTYSSSRIYAGSALCTLADHPGEFRCMRIPQVGPELTRAISLASIHDLQRRRR